MITLPLEMAGAFSLGEGRTETGTLVARPEALPCRAESL